MAGLASPGTTPGQGPRTLPGRGHGRPSTGSIQKCQRKGRERDTQPCPALAEPTVHGGDRPSRERGSWHGLGEAPEQGADHGVGLQGADGKAGGRTAVLCGAQPTPGQEEGGAGPERWGWPTQRRGQPGSDLV